MVSRQNLNRLAYFVAVIEEGSITGAAARAGVSKAVISKQLQLLEQDVGTPLVLRDTRKMQPTDAGRSFFEAARSAVHQAEVAFAAVTDRGDAPKGRLRITAPVDYGLSHVAPLVTLFGARYPQVEVDLHLSDERRDIVADRFDIAFRIGWLAESGHLARKLQDFEEIVVAAAGSDAAHAISKPEDLRHLPFVVSESIAGVRTWAFTRGSETREVTLASTSTMNLTLAIRAVLPHWPVFTILPDFLVEDAIADGRLVRLLPGWALRTGGIYTLTAPTTVRSSALKAFVEMVRQDLAR